jgi:hypothetical protein
LNGAAPKDAHKGVNPAFLELHGDGSLRRAVSYSTDGSNYVARQCPVNRGFMVVDQLALLGENCVMPYVKIKINN